MPSLARDLAHHPACPGRRDEDAVCWCMTPSPLDDSIDAVYLTGHARQRAQEMGVLLTDVIATILKPDIAYEQSDRGPGCAVHQRGGIAVAIRRTATSIVALSVLPRMQAVYSR